MGPGQGRWSPALPLFRMGGEFIAGPKRVAGLDGVLKEVRLSAIPWLRHWALFAMARAHLCHLCSSRGCDRDCAVVSDLTTDAALAAITAEADILELVSAGSPRWTLSLEMDRSNSDAAGAAAMEPARGSLSVLFAQTVVLPDQPVGVPFAAVRTGLGGGDVVGHGRVELTRFLTPAAISREPRNAPAIAAWNRLREAPASTANRSPVTLPETVMP